MNLVKPSFEIITQEDYTLLGILKFIERCGRVCYKSEDKITEDSYIKFVNNLIKKDHSRPLEFGTVVLKCSTSDYYRYQLHSIDSLWVRASRGLSHYIITTNYRALLELFRKQDKSIADLNSFIKHNCSDEIIFVRPTVHFVLSRGCMDDFRTHVSLSHLGESTRYCNYTNDKFGGMTYIIPQWCQNIIESKQLNNLDDINAYIHSRQCSPEEIIFLKGLITNEASYETLISLGKIPQESREILPLCVKSELISCGFIDAWNNFFYRRNDIAAQPEAKLLAGQLQTVFNNKFSESYNYLM